MQMHFNPLEIKELWEIVLTYSVVHKEESLNKEFRSLFYFCSSYEAEIGSKNFLRYKFFNDDSKNTFEVVSWRQPGHYDSILYPQRHPMENYDGYIWNFKTGKKTEYKLSKYHWWSIGNYKNALY